MSKIKYLGLLPVAILLLASCNLGSSNPSLVPATPAVASTGTVTVSVVNLAVQATNAGDTFNAVGQVINYQYKITNTGIVPLTGNVIVSDNRVTVTCPNTNTVGNLNDILDPNESVICTSTLPIIQADLTAGSVVTVASANVGGFTSNQVSTTVTFTPAQTSGLKLMKTASPLSFSQVGQVITYTYVIQNLGTAAIGPTQFMITDDKMGAPFNCGAAGTTIQPQQSIKCSANYAVVQADLIAGRVINTATASGGGANVSPPATTTVTAAIPPSSGSGLTRGSTIQHTVVKDEWMIQIARCYAASFDAVRAANPQVIDPDIISIGEVLTVPNIGSNGTTIYGPPCVDHYTVQSGDTWASIAQKFNADVVVLQAANRDGMAVGTVLKIPLNSAGSLSSIPITGTTVTPTLTLTPTPTATITPTVTGTPPAPAGQGTPITFPAGASSATLTGTVPAQGTVRYTLSANQGQIMTLKVTAPTNELAVIITDPNGTVLPPLNATTLTWNAILAVTGTYRIDMSGVQGQFDKLYSLEVSLVTPTPTP